MFNMEKRYRNKIIIIIKFLLYIMPQSSAKEHLSLSLFLVNSQECNIIHN